MPHRHHGVASAGLSLQRMKWGLWAWVQGQSQASWGAGYRKRGSSHPNRSRRVRGAQGQGVALPAPRRSLEGREPHTLHPHCLGGPTAWHLPRAPRGHFTAARQMWPSAGRTSEVPPPWTGDGCCHPPTRAGPLCILGFAEKAGEHHPEAQALTSNLQRPLH